MRTRAAAAVGWVVALLASAAVSAHHSFAMFESEKQIELAGVIRDFHWTNPHSWIFLNVKDVKGQTVEWKIEGGSPNLLKRDGWTRRSLIPGQPVTVRIRPAKDGTSYGSLVRVTLADGTQLGSR